MCCKLNEKRLFCGKLVNDGLPWIHLFKLQLKYKKCEACEQSKNMIGIGTTKGTKETRIATNSLANIILKS